MKKLLMVMLLILVSGCSCKYNLSIKNAQIKETLTINGVTTGIPEQADLVNISTHEYSKNLNGNILEYQTSYYLNNYKTSDFLTCFDSYTFLEEENNYILRTGKKFKCLPYQYNDFDILRYDKLEITLTTNHQVLDSNADYVEKGVYHWFITADNVDDTEIYFKISKDAKQPIIILALAVFMLIVGVIGFIAYLVAKSKSSKNNQI